MPTLGWNQLRVSKVDHGHDKRDERCLSEVFGIRKDSKVGFEILIVFRVFIKR